ncbi:glycoside hydrolase family 125 protein [Cohnella hongkongensis]|uniref:Glycoside hydrolase family 125 protein n=1 Tax=Cohnella hongkongensis TaxID=178337 RepID=A0ABV9FBU3_9BACL
MPRIRLVLRVRDGRAGPLSLMDDAGKPGLLSIPLLRICPGRRSIYLNTRAFVLSRSNSQPEQPYYFPLFFIPYDFRYRNRRLRPQR